MHYMQVLDECGDVAMALLQNKVDLIEQSAVSSEEVEAMARRLNLRLYRGCVREDLNVESGRLPIYHSLKIPVLS